MYVRNSLSLEFINLTVISREIKVIPEIYMNITIKILIQSCVNISSSESLRKHDHFAQYNQLYGYKKYWHHTNSFRIKLICSLQDQLFCWFQ